MDWYKIANLWEEVKKYGPAYPVIPLGETKAPKYDPDMGLALQYLKEEYPEDTEEELRKRVNNAMMGEWYRRRGFVNTYGWSVPTEKAIEEIKKFVGNDKVIEVGSGYGLWAKFMQDVGIQIVSTDKIITDKSKEQVPKEHRYVDVEELDNLQSMQEYGDFGVLMTVWPPYDDPMAFETLKAFRGNKLIFVGEGNSGCNACYNFFNLLQDKWTEVNYVDIPQWQDIHDRLYLYVRK